VHGQQITDLRRLVEQYIDDDRLRQGLAELIDLSIAGAEGSMGSLSTVGAVPDHTAAPTPSLDGLDASEADLRTAEASRDGVDDDDTSGHRVVCGERTTQAVRPMGWLTEPIWCCHEHDDRTIVHAWIQQLPEWRQLQSDDQSRTAGPARAPAIAAGKLRQDPSSPVRAGHLLAAAWLRQQR
jgi:hypothetical protein